MSSPGRTSRRRAAPIAAVLLCAAVLAGGCGAARAPKPDADYRSLNDRSATLINAGRFADALTAAEEALQVNPAYSFAWNNKSIALLGLGRTEEALTAAVEAVRTKPDNALAWSNKSVVLRVQGKIEEAVQAAEEALRLDPRNAVVWYNKASYFALLGLPEAALGSLGTAFELDPSLKVPATREPDLQSLRDRPEFRQLLQ